jgi:hypothetical protein
MMSTDAGDQAGACARDLKITVENGNDDCVLEIVTQAGQHMAQPRYVESVGRPLAGKSPELPAACYHSGSHPSAAPPRVLA